jgi:hypothetical protein
VSLGFGEGLCGCFERLESFKEQKRKEKRGNLEVVVVQVSEKSEETRQVKEGCSNQSYNLRRARYSLPCHGRKCCKKEKERREKTQAKKHTPAQQAAQHAAQPSSTQNKNTTPIKLTSRTNPFFLKTNRSKP